MRLKNYLNEDSSSKFLSKLEKFKKDLKKLTKIYKSVDDKEKFVEARHLFHKFADTWEDFVYSDLLTKDSKKENYVERQVRSSAWKFQGDLRDPFPEQYNPITREHEPDIKRFQKERDKTIRRYQKSFREAYDDIKEFIELGDSPKESAQTQFKFRGVNVDVDLRKEEEESEKIIKKFLNGLESSIGYIKRRGFENFLKDLTIHLRSKSRGGGLTAGEYDTTTGDIYIYGLGVWNKEWTIVHEIGHRFYFKGLPQRAKKVWDSVLKNDTEYITETDVENFYNKYVKDEIISGEFPDKDKIKKDVYRDLEQRKMSPRNVAVFKYIADNFRWPFDLSTVLKRLLRQFGNEKFNMKYITTDYGTTNPWEAFAEAFKMYVIQGPGSLDIWTSTFFRNISKAGGAKLREWLEKEIWNYLNEDHNKEEFTNEI